MFARLNSGYLSEDSADDKGTSLEKECLIVYPGVFESMDGEVEVTPEHIEMLAKNHNSLFEKAKRLALGQEVPLRECPPLQLDHQTTATHTVGRLVGPLMIRETKIDGESKPALFGRVRVLGAENVEKVKDGRWIHLSMGADLEEGKLSELTITPFPAAEHAAMLAKKKPTPIDPEMFKPVKVIKINDDEINILRNVTGKYYAEIAGKYVGSLFERQEDAEKDGRLAAEKLNVATGVFFQKKLAHGSPDSDQVQGELSKTELPGHVDEALWKKAKEACQKEYGEIRWPVVTHIYEEMGGKFHKESKISKGESMFQKLRKRLAGDTSHKQEPEKLKEGEIENEDVIQDIDEDSAHKKEPERLTYDEMKHAMEMYAKCRKHLMNKMGMGEDDAEKKLSGMGNEEIEKMAAEHDEDEEKMAQKEPERLSRLHKVNEARARLSTAQKEVKFAQKKAKLAIRLSSLRASGKITPAEIKKIDMNKLAAASEEATNLTLESYENRQPVIDPRVYGSARGVGAAELIKLAADKELEKETVAHFSSLGKTRFSEQTDDNLPETIRKEVQELHPVTHGEELKAIMKHMEAGEHKEAYDKLKACMSKLEEGKGTSDEVMSSDAEKHLSALADKSLALENTLNETDNLLKELVGA